MKNIKSQARSANRFIQICLLPVLFLLPLLAFGQGEVTAQAATTAEPATRYSSTLAYILIGVVILLTMVLYFMSKVVILSARIKLERNEKAVKNVAKAILLFLLLQGQEVLAQATTAAAATPAPAPESTVPAYLIYLLGSVLFLEFIIILYFTSMIFGFLKPAAEENVAQAVEKRSRWKNLFYRKNTEEEMAKLDLGHNYDGIKELDNAVPGWWKMGFYLSIGFAIVYLFAYHIGKLAPLQQEELKIAQTNAEKKKIAGQKNAQNQLDENSVTMLSGADLDAGKAIFMKPGACATCHGEDGSGLVNGNPGIGPNLTDKYWLHKGSIKDIFYSIKYGWPEKGMKPWKDDYSPLQIAQLASYVKSLQGSNPAKGKDKQGELFEEEAAAAKSAPADSAKAN